MLDYKEFERLQKLSCVTLNDDKKKKLFSQVWDIVVFLNKLNELDIDKVVWVSDDNLLSTNLRTIDWINDFENRDWLLKNVFHEKINNNIVIKSVLD